MGRWSQGAAFVGRGYTRDGKAFGAAPAVPHVFRLESHRKPRHPVQRAISNFHLSRRHQPGRTLPTFEEALRQIEGIRQRGLYARHLRLWFSHFGREQILILDFNRFVHSDQTVVDRCFDFLGVPSAEVALPHANQSSREVEVSPEVKAELREFYRPHNRELYELLDRDFGWPS